MFSVKKYAYVNVRNYVCAQIAIEKERLNSAMYDKNDNAEYIEDRYDAIATYNAFLNVMSHERDRIIK